MNPYLTVPIALPGDEADAIRQSVPANSHDNK